jgi:hypothetical protein
MIQAGAVKYDTVYVTGHSAIEGNHRHCLSWGVNIPQSLLRAITHCHVSLSHVTIKKTSNSAWR